MYGASRTRVGQPSNMEIYNMKLKNIYIYNISKGFSYINIQTKTFSLWNIYASFPELIM